MGYAVDISKSKDDDFADLCAKIVSLINLKDSVRNSNEKNHLRKELIFCLDSQISILHSIQPFISSAKNDQKRMSTAEMVNSELEHAEELYEQGLLSLAGVTAINTLEIYLHSLCDERESNCCQRIQ
ncbi:MAG: hypothetical protein R2741_04315 [Methanolobus sp.]